MDSADLDELTYERDLAKEIANFYDDLYGFVMFAFPWGVKGGPLEDQTGPDDWQADQHDRIHAILQKKPNATIREAIASGHGIGKSAEVAWIILWAMSTRVELNGVITANTTSQLSTKTWRELAVWHKRMVNAHWFKWTATKFFHVEHPETWFTAAIPNTEHNSEAFAGQHAKHVLIIYDEASAIPDKIWEVSEGAMSTARAMWFVYGNPTRNTGRFRKCFDSDKRWVSHQVDARTCKMTNNEEFASQVEEYGEDSDFVRVRIKGQFPRAGSVQFISSEIVDRAMLWSAPLEVYYAMPILIGVDVARFGGDQTVIAIRQGRKLLELRKFRELDTMETTHKVVQAMTEFRPRMVFVDEVGVGAGVVDRLRELGHRIVGVNAGNKPEDEKVYYNKRIEMWDRMRQWLKEHADLPATDIGLKESLIGIEYGFDEKEKMRLETKKDMKKRGLESPDEGDAIAHTFAEIMGAFHEDSFEPEEGTFEPDDLYC
jgi:hypothetical protein